MNAIPPQVQSVLDLFAAPLRDVRFADVDATTLASHANEAQAAADVVVAAEAQLARARQALQDKQDALLAHAQRALAYARVYADADASLGAALDQIALPRAPRRGRGDGEALSLELEPVPAARARGRRIRSVARGGVDETPALPEERTSAG